MTMRHDTDDPKSVPKNRQVLLLAASCPTTAPFKFLAECLRRASTSVSDVKQEQSTSEQEQAGRFWSRRSDDSFAGTQLSELTT